MKNKKNKILYVGTLAYGETTFERFKALQNLGYQTTGISFNPKTGWGERILLRLLRPFKVTPDFHQINKKILQAISTDDFDFIWIDKGLQITATTIKAIKKKSPKTIVIHFNPDDPFGRFNKPWGTFLKALPYYDVHFVSRWQNVKEIEGRGGKQVFYYDRSYAKEIHKPMKLTAAEQQKYSCDVGFIGSYEENRARKIAYLIQQGIPVRLYTDGWKNQPYWTEVKENHKNKSIIGAEYAKGLSGMKIGLHFLRKGNRDEQDSRTFEIPACGTFLLAERSSKHEQLFEDGKEAVFFDNEEDLLKKINYYLTHPEERKKIAAAGRLKCITAGYDHESRMAQLLSWIQVNQ